MSGFAQDPDFPCSINLTIPLPTNRLATIALQAIQVDPELSPLVRRSMSVVAATDDATPSDKDYILRVEYSATTNRMLRVAVNSFMDSLKLVLEVMEQLDVDMLDQSKKNNQESS